MAKDNNKYLIERRYRIKQYMRIRLGVLQLFERPYFNIFWIPLVILSIGIWQQKEKAMIFFNVPQILFPAFRYAVYAMSILIPILLLLCVLDTIGELSARRDESNLEIAFTEKELRNGCPILMNKKKVKGTDVTVREFYSNIPLKIWNEKINSISDSMNVHLVETIKYGGKGNGKRIVLCTATGRKPTERDDLYDEEL